MKRHNLVCKLLLWAAFIPSIYGTPPGIPVPTGIGMNPCKKWPNFYLQDFNLASDATYLQMYGLEDLLPVSDVTVVGLYAADSLKSQEQIVLQEDIGFYLEKKKKISVQNVAINLYAPTSCLYTECANAWFSAWNPFFANACDGYIGGCSPGTLLHHNEPPRQHNTKHIAQPLSSSCV